jgi:hypothetical protein
MERSNIEMERDDWERKYTILEILCLERKQELLKARCAEYECQLEKAGCGLKVPFQIEGQEVLIGSSCRHELTIRSEQLKKKVEEIRQECARLDGPLEALKQRVRELESHGNPAERSLWKPPGFVVDILSGVDKR